MSGNIYLVGFMGTGKSAVGALLARRLQRPFIDADRRIERLAKMSVKEIFARQGEKKFRALERRVVGELARRRGVVAALGGGALLSPQNRVALEKSGTLIALTCSQRALWKRLKRQLPDRPLLREGYPAFCALRGKRRRLEKGIARRVSTTRRSVAQAAARAAWLLGGRR